VVTPFAYSDGTISSTTVQAALTLTHDLRLERPVPAPRDLDRDLPGRFGEHRLGSGSVAHVRALAVWAGTVLLVPEMLGQLLVQRGLEHVLREQLQQPVRPGQGKALLVGQPDQLGRRRGLRGSVIILVLLRTHNVQCRSHHGTFPATHHARRVRPETPLDPQSLGAEQQEDVAAVLISKSNESVTLLGSAAGLVALGAARLHDRLYLGALGEQRHCVGTVEPVAHRGDDRRRGAQQHE